MDNLPLVSIITPSFNQAKYLEYTMRSVLEQDYPNLEYLVADGGSTDGSQDIIRKYSSRLSWWVSEKDSGQAEGINKGLQRAQGEIIAWLNSDDMFASGAIRKAVKVLMEKPELGMVFSNVFSIDADNVVFNTMRYEDYGLAELMAFNIIGQPGVFMRRWALEKAGLLDPAYQYLLDHQLWLRIAMYASIQHVDDYFAAARFHPAAKNVAMAAKFGHEAFAMVDWMKSQPELDEIYARDRRKILAGAYLLSARYLLDGGMNANALGHYLKSLWYHPARAWHEKRRILYAFASLILPMGRVREEFIQRRAENVRSVNLQEYMDLFDYGQKE